MDTKERIKNLVKDYTQSLEEINEFIFGTTLSFATFKDQYKELQEYFNSEDERMYLFTKLNTNIPKYTAEINVFALINAVARTEAFLNDIVECLFLWNRKSLISDKTLTYKELIEFDNLDELINLIRQREILEFSHASYKLKLKIFNKKFNLTFPEIEKIQTQITELFTTRNLILHNNGIINQTYIEQNKDTKFKLGSKRNLDEKYIRNGIENLGMVVYYISHNTIEKISK